MATVRVQIRVEGLVQGVGFRPFVYALATRLHLGGYVLNDGQGVLIEVEGNQEDVQRLVSALGREAPALACIERVSSRAVPRCGQEGFHILPSHTGQERAAFVSSDMATCAQCWRELFDPTDRRFRYPFINCTHCGPRFTIIVDVPYDRVATTMAGFTMCQDCAAEYHDPTNRRFHAQPVACPACGPWLRLCDRQGQLLPGEPLAHAVALIRAGHIVAVKGLGGYHFAVDATNEAAVAALRHRKHRQAKPFAIMAPDMDTVRSLVELGSEEEQLLSSRQRPIVLLRRLAHPPLAPDIAPGSRFLGIMLPYTPLHHLLVHDLGRPMVLTSGNISDEPIAYRDETALAQLHSIADAFLIHNRPIHIRTDDSVGRCFRGAPMLLRRSRGYAPQPLRLPWAFPQPVLACGAELKNSICVAKGQHAFLSHHIGDLENYESFQSFTEAITHFQRLFDVRPQVVAYDLHPDYLSTKWALAQADVALCGVQHHHAHVVSCLADNGVAGPVIGVAFDGLGYGTDGTLWGGEFLVADLKHFERLGHLTAIPMPGGSAAIKEPWRMAATYLDAAFDQRLPALAIVQRHARQWPVIRQMVRRGLHAPRTSSMGRLFDAVAALLDVRDVVSYEGQAAIELEQLADPTETACFSVALQEGPDGFEIPGAALIGAIVEALLHQEPLAAIAGRFHNSIAAAILHGCQAIRAQTGLSTVALSGGVFQNMLLLERTVERLEMQGFQVLCHRQVPPNDGGISLGQAVIASQTMFSSPG